MRAGTAVLVALCTIYTIRHTPASPINTDNWRWYAVSAAFVLWMLSWAIASVAPPSAGPFLSLLGLGRQVLFLVALLPTANEDQGWQLRALDVAQVILLGAILAILAWPGVWFLHLAKPDARFLYVGHIALATVAIASYLRQTGQIRCLIGPLAIMHSVYAITSVVAKIAYEQWALADNSPIWVFGDAAFIVYLLLPFQTRKSNHGSRLAAIRRLRDLPPLLLTGVILMLSVELGRRSLPWGMGVATAGLSIYASRTTLLNNRYLKMRDRLIKESEARGRALVDLVHEVRSPLCSIKLNAWLLSKSEIRSEPHRQWAEQIHASVTRVALLLDDVLDLERLDAGSHN